MKIIFTIMPLLYLAGNGYLLWKVWQATTLPLWCKIIICVILSLVAFSLFMAIGLRGANIPHPVLKAMFNIGSIWMVFMFYMVLLLLVFDIVGIFAPVRKYSFALCLAVTTVTLICGYINYRHPKVEQIDINLAKSQNTQSLRIVAISDIHLGYGTSAARLKGYVDMINAQKPDVVVIAGDLIDNSTRPLASEPYAETLSTLRAPMGIYMTLGNHEYISGIDSCIKFIQSTPIKLLRDSSITLPSGLQIIGRDDRSNRHRKSLQELLNSANKDNPIVLVDHQPYELEKADSLEVEFQIYGHTHRGQIWPLNLLTDHLYSQSHGYRHWSHSHTIVSSGLSLWGPPFRIGTRSDMYVIDIKW